VSRLATIWLLVVAGGLALAGALGSFDGVLVKLLPDDAFYYLEIARRIAEGQGSTFDGIHPTNGYHPLWLAVLVPLGPLLDASRVAGARVALLLGVGLVLAAIRAVWRAAESVAPDEAPLGAVWLGGTLLVASVYGMEAPLAVALAGALWWRISRGWPDTPAQGAALGGLAAALTLARLDAGLVVAGAFLVWLADAARSRRWGAWVAGVAVLGAVVGAYLAANELDFGSALPISAKLKSARQGGPNLVWAGSLLARLGVGTGVVGVVAAALDRRPVVLAAAAGVGLNLAALAIGGGRETYNWYFAVPVLAGGLFGPVIARALRARGVPGVSAAAWVLAVGLLLVAVRGKLQPTNFAEKIHRAEWLSTHAPEDAVFAEGDCGILGYVSGRPFVNLDGLTNAVSWADVVDEGDVGRWLLESGVNAVAAPTGQAPGPWLARGRARVTLAPEVVPWDPPIGDAEYTLWRVVGLAPAR
jgi:hypothetical protein